MKAVLIFQLRAAGGSSLNIGRCNMCLYSRFMMVGRDYGQDVHIDAKLTITECAGSSVT